MTEAALTVSAARTAKNACTIVGLLVAAAMSGLNASRFPTYYASMGEMLSGLVQGITPLAATIAAVALCVGMAAVLTKFILFLMQFVISFTVRSQGEADAMNRIGVPFHLRLEMVDEEGNAGKFYYTWKWEHLLFVATILQVIFIGRMGYFAHLG